MRAVIFDEYLTQPVDRINLASACRHMRDAVHVSATMKVFDASKLLSSRDFDVYIDTLEQIGHDITTFRVARNFNFMWRLTARVPDFCTLMPNLHTIELSNVSTIMDLRFLKDLPRLKSITLESITVDAKEFTDMLPPFADQLESLSIPRNINLSVYDIVQIVQSMSKLKFLDISESGFIRVGTAQTILTYCKDLTTLWCSPDFWLDDAVAWCETVQLDFHHIIYSTAVYNHVIEYNRYLTALRSLYEAALNFIG